VRVSRHDARVIWYAQAMHYAAGRQVWVTNPEFTRLEEEYRSLLALVELGEVAEVEVEGVVDQRHRLWQIQRELAKTPRGYWTAIPAASTSTTNYTLVPTGGRW